MSAEENRRLIEGVYAAFARWDLPAMFAAFDENIFWHIPGRGELTGDYRGHRDVLGFFQRFMQSSGGTFRVQVEELLASDRRVLALVTESAERNGRKWSSPQVHAWTVEKGKATVFWQFQGDQGSEDEFWS
jgi:hypothetical protein